MLGLIPLSTGSAARLDRVGVEGAERLCHVFEVYRQIAPESRFTMDQLIRLVSALSGSQEFVIGHCQNCHGALLLDRLGDGRRLCPACREDALNRGADVREAEDRETGDSAPTSLAESAESRQQSLF